MEKIGAKEVILILIDISGYTNFMIKNKQTVHSQRVISDILRRIIDDVKIPLRVAKLEGDAVFLYAVRQQNGEWHEEKQAIGERLESFFVVFADELVRLADSKLCQSNSCKSLDKLRLKVFVHSGEALFQTIRGFEELSGVDVIKIHRLLKNDIKIDHYILFTKEGLEAVPFKTKSELVRHDEPDAELGTILTYVACPTSEPCFHEK